MGNTERTKFNEIVTDEQVADLLSKLKRVDAPQDFDFRVRARIAGRRSEAKAPHRTWLPATLRVAVPLALLVAVGGYFGFNSLYPTSVDMRAPSIAETKPVSVSAPPIVVPANEIAAQPSADVIQQPANQLVASRTEVKSDESIAKPAKIAPENTNSNNQPGEERSDSGSYVEASRDVVILSPVANNNGSQIQKTVDSANTNGHAATKIRARDVLAVMGIHAAYTVGGWKVISVSASSLASRSGVKAGDVIVTLNGLPLKAQTEFDSGFSGQSVGVKRDGESLHLSLSN